MPQIVTKTHFQKSNFLYIPLSENVPSANASVQSPNSVSYIDNLCIEVEKDVLLNALGLTIYNELQLALADINNPLNAKYKKLVEGEEYSSKVWKGLSYDFSLIACKIYEEYLRRKNEELTGVGSVYLKAEKAEKTSPNSQIIRANQLFFKQYQDRENLFPKVENNTLDWFNLRNDIEVSLFRYLSDKASDFNWSPSNFRMYRNSIVNDFGL